MIATVSVNPKNSVSRERVRPSRGPNNSQNVGSELADLHLRQLLDGRQPPDLEGVEASPRQLGQKEVETLQACGKEQFVVRPLPEDPVGTLRGKYRRRGVSSDRTRHQSRIEDAARERRG